MPNRTALSVPRTQASYAYPLGVLRNRPYAYFRMNEPSGRGIVNLVTGKTIANAYSATGVTYGVAGGFASDPSTGITFDGASGSVTLPMPTAQVNTLSLECRIKLTSASSTGVALKVGTLNTGYGLGIGGTTLDNTGTQFITAFDNNSWNVSGTNLSVGVWHYLVWTFTATDIHTWYVDGTQVQQLTQNFIVTPTTNNYLGSDAASRYANFTIADCAFYNYGLSSAQVAAQALLAQ